MSLGPGRDARPLRTQTPRDSRTPLYVRRQTTEDPPLAARTDLSARTSAPRSCRHLRRGAPSAARLEDGRGGGAAHAAGGVERVDAEELVDQAAGDAEHRRAAVLALGVELEGLDLRVVVAHPRVERDVAGLGVV